MTARFGSQPVNPPAGRSAPRRLLWLLGLLVMLVHGLLLDAIPLALTTRSAVAPLKPTALVFNTRRIEIPPVKVSQPAQVAPTQPPPTLLQQPTIGLPQVAVDEPLSPPVEADNPPLETPTAEPVQPLPVEPLEPVASESPAPQAQANLNVPGSVRLKYQMTGLSRGLNYHATGVMTWLQDGSRYEATMVVSAFLIGSRSLSSVGDITVDGLAPKRFTDKGRKELTTYFQTDEEKITFSGNTPDAPWQRGVQDRLSVFFQLTSLLAGEPDRYPLGTQIPVYTAGPRDAATWTFSVAGHEELSLPHSTLTALKLTRDPRQASDQRVEAWFAPSLGYWPVRIKVTQQGGDYIDQQLSSSGPP